MNLNDIFKEKGLGLNIKSLTGFAYTSGWWKILDPIKKTYKSFDTSPFLLKLYLYTIFFRAMPQIVKKNNWTNLFKTKMSSYQLNQKNFKPIIREEWGSGKLQQKWGKQ